jgi:DUF4097 and DUF4098 domain-containing protein YvlB
MRHTNILLIIAIVLLLVGITVIMLSIAANGWDFSMFKSSSHEIITHNISEGIRDISIDTDTANVIFIPSDNNEYKVVCRDARGLKHNVTENDGILSITLTDTRKWYEYISFSFDNTEIAVYIPAEEYGVLDIDISTGDVDIPNNFKFESVNIEATTGDIDFGAEVESDLKITASTGYITLEGVEAGAIDLAASTGNMSLSDIHCTGGLKLSLSTGKVTANNVNCTSLYSTADTGDIILTSLIAKETIDITRSTGDVKFDACDASQITVNTSTGDVTGSFLSDKIFITHSGTGKNQVPETTTGGICRIECSTGDIIIEIKK